MKKLLVLSGKGGTGKTTTAAAFIHFLDAKAFADCDVDAPNLHLVTKMKAKPQCSDYKGSQKAHIDAKKCTACGKCIEHCRFNAIQNSNKKYSVNEYACEGCGVCEMICPANAVKLCDDIAGELTLYKDERVFSTAMLKMGRGNSGMLVSEVKKNMQKSAENADVAVIDGSPGIGCPVISSITGVNLVLIVTEPTVSGLSDLERILRTASVLRTKTAVCINKYDTCVEQADKIKQYCSENDVPFVGCIPFDKEVSEAVNNGISIAQLLCPASEALRQVFDKTMALLKE